MSIRFVAGDRDRDGDIGAMQATLNGPYPIDRVIFQMRWQRKQMRICYKSSIRSSPRGIELKPCTLRFAFRLHHIVHMAEGLIAI